MIFSWRTSHSEAQNWAEKRTAVHFDDNTEFIFEVFGVLLLGSFLILFGFHIFIDGYLLQFVWGFVGLFNPRTRGYLVDLPSIIRTLYHHFSFSV